MKKTILSLLLLPIFLYCQANTIPACRFMVSELYFTDDANWQMEIEYFFGEPDISVDSLFISSSTEIVKITGYEITETSGFFVITPDSVSSQLTVNREGDILTVMVYSEGEEINEKYSLVFGNYPYPYRLTNFTNAPGMGQSICLLPNYSYTLDASPTIGVPNDTTGCCATIKGKITDKNGFAVKNTTFIINYENRDLPISTDEEGNYTAKLYCMKYPDTLTFIQYPFFIQEVFLDISIVPIQFPVIEPDVSYTIDFQLQNARDNIVQVEESVCSQVSVVHYPNPASDHINFVFDIPTEISNRLSIDIYNSMGGLIEKIPVENNSNYVKWTIPDNLQNSIYYYVLLAGNKKVASRKFILIK